MPGSPNNPMASTALLTNLAPFLTGLAMLGLKYQVGPKALLFWASQLGGFFMFGLMVVGSAFILVAYTRSEGVRDWRIPAAGLLWLLSLAEVILFMA
ncbi:MAG: hypothetical protein ACOY94_17175 [Bacillota bacterium]